MSQDTIATIFIVIAVLALFTLFTLAMRENKKIRDENEKYFTDLLNARLEILGYKAVTHIDGQLIHDMQGYITEIENKLAAANVEIEALKRRTLGYDAEFDTHVDDALAVVAQATGGDDLPTQELELSTQDGFMSEEQMLSVLNQAAELFTNDPNLGVVSGTFDDNGNPVVTSTERKNLADVVPFKKAGH